ncbi:MAG: GGDEF domain-containing protein [Paracoccaceae bacterium]
MTAYRIAVLLARALLVAAAVLVALPFLGHLMPWPVFALWPGAAAMPPMASVTAGLVWGALALAPEHAGARITLASLALVLTLTGLLPGLELLGLRPGAISLLLMLALIAAGVLLIEAERAAAAQFLFFVAAFFGGVGVMSIVVAAPDLFGVMSSFGAGAVVTMAAAGLLRWSHRGVMRSLLSPLATAHRVRLMLLAGGLGPALIGWYFLGAAPEAVSLQRAVEMLLAIMLFLIVVVVRTGHKAVMADRERRQLEKQLERLAHYDMLTGAGRRSLLERRFDREKMLADRLGGAFSLVLVDLDFFKDVNDMGGHAFGDLVLQRAVRRMQAVLRRQDTLARIGGEEFAVLLPGADLAEAIAVAERLRGAVAEMRVAWQGVVHDRQTASLGVAQWAPDESLRGLLERADRALFGAKEHGRDRVLVALPAKTAPQAEAVP